VVGQNVKRKVCEESTQEYPTKEKSVGKPRRRWLDDVDNDLKITLDNKI
jgi:hypothetical protein